VFSTTSTGDEIVEALQIYHLSITSFAPLKAQVQRLNAEINGIPYTTVDFDDRLLAIAPAGDAVLLIGRPDPAATSNDTEGRLILWRPNEPTASLAIDTFDTEAICQAAFAPDAPTRLVIVLADGRLAQYDTLTHTAQFLNAHLSNGCMDRYFSPDGNWLAVPYNSLGQIAFLDIRRLSTTGGDTSLHPPMAKAGQPVILTDADGDGRAALTLDGSQSTDSDGNIVDYVWSLGAAPLVNNGQSVRLDLTREQVGNGLLFTLTVTDNDGLRDTTSIQVTFKAIAPSSP
jgi:WD40 repeat protein